MIEEIKSFLIENITHNYPIIKDNKSITEFVMGLETDDDISAKRLLICIGIDVQNSIDITCKLQLSENHYIINLRRCILNASNCDINTTSFPGELTNRWKFAWALNNIDFKDKMPIITCENKLGYSRVYNFSSYLKYVVNINREYNLGVDYIDSDEDEINRHYLKFKSGKKFVNCNVTRLGYDRFVFIADTSEIETIGYENTENIVDSLGLYIEDTQASEKFVCLNYKNKYKSETWQPDSLTGDWGSLDENLISDGNDFYLSYPNKDGYGRTFSISGKSKQLKERVHLPFDHEGQALYEMKAECLGSIDNQIIKGTDEAMLVEAIERFKSSGQ